MPKFDIAGHRKIWFLISLVLIIPGFICMGMRGFNFGIDFTGGTIIDMRFEQPVLPSTILMGARFSFPEQRRGLSPPKM